ncbi:MAG: hypothetical protein ACJ8AT_14660 [Hyalangium sp.]|uniref:hypothetical protein n=1 Tax=Hyalangium sp. TaxID=2028555 RepID=UPI003899F1DE
MSPASTPVTVEVKKLKALLDTHGRAHLQVRAEPGGTLVVHSQAKDGTEEQHVRLTPAAGGARWSISLRGDGGGWREKAQAASLEEAVDVLVSGQPSLRG